MPRPLRFGLQVVVLLCFAQQQAPAAIDDATRHWMQSTLDEWRESCRRDLQIAPPRLPWIIFFDETHAWHVNPDRRRLPEPSRAQSSLRFSGRKYKVFELRHEGTLWAPDRDPLPVKPQFAAMPYDDETKSFFIAGSLPFSHRALKVDASDKSFDTLMTGTVLHELTHTLHLPQLAAQMKQLQSKYRLPESIDDNVIEKEFQANREFREMFDAESKRFSAAIVATDPAAMRADATAGLEILGQRRKRFFVDRYQGWDEAEDSFLALEGPAMWVQYRYALRKAPKGQSWLDTLAALTQQTDAWSQMEGLGVFLLIDRLRPQWQLQFLRKDIPSPTEFLRQAIAAHAVH